MTTARSAGRIAGALILVQGIGGYLVNFGLIAPATAPPGFLVNAAPHASPETVALSWLVVSTRAPLTETP